MVGEEISVSCHQCGKEIQDNDEVIVMDYREDYTEITDLWIYHRNCIDSISIEREKVLSEGRWEEVRGNITGV